MKVLHLLSFLAFLQWVVCYLNTEQVLIMPDRLPSGVVIVVSPTDKTRDLLLPDELDKKLTSIVKKYKDIVIYELDSKVKHVYNSAFHGLAVEFTDLLKLDQFLDDKLSGHTDIFNNANNPAYVAKALQKALMTPELKKYGIELVVSPDSAVKIN